MDQFLGAQSFFQKIRVDAKLA
jgi:hypothetical protein